MKRFFSTHFSNNTALLSEQEAHHAMQVLRCRSGETVEVVNGNGACWQGEIFSQGKKEAFISGLRQVGEVKENLQMLTLAIAPPKKTDRLEWAIEKVIELGVKEIILLKTVRTERSKVNIDRLRLIAISAMKQSGHLFLPQIHDMTTLSELWTFPVSQHFLAFCSENNEQNLLNLACEAGKSVLVSIGPEGDFTEKEVMTSIQAGWKPISLGKSRLRVETAAVYSTAIVKTLNGL